MIIKNWKNCDEFEIVLHMEVVTDTTEIPENIEMIDELYKILVK